MLHIELPSGQVVQIDELSGDIIADAPTQPPAGQPNTGRSGGLAGPSFTKFGSATAPSGDAGAERPFDPNTDPITETVKVPGGTQVSYIRNGQLKTAFISDEESASGGVSQNTQYAQQQQNARDAAQRAEEQRQFNEQFGFDKAQFNTTFPEQQRQFDERLGFDNEELDVRRGEALLGLGSRPESLIRYLYALRGQQAPQGGPALALPGFPGQPSGNVTATTAPAQTARTGGGQRKKTTTEASTRDVLRSKFGGYDLTDQSGATTGFAFTPSGGTAGSAAVNVGNKIVGYGPNGDPIFMARGGVIPEPVIGRGLMSGRTYAFGEEGPERVRPAEKPYEADDSGSYQTGGTIGYPTGYEERDGGIYSQRSGNMVDLAQAGSGLRSQFGLSPTAVQQRSIDTGTNRYFDAQRAAPRLDRAGAGQRGRLRRGGERGGFGHDDPGPASWPLRPVPPGGAEPVLHGQNTAGQSQQPGGPTRGGDFVHTYGERGGGAPQGGFAPPSLFQQPGRNPFGFPQVPAFTGGSSLIPSAQRLFQATPTEREFYAGYLQDEYGLPAQDVFDLARRLAPQVSGLRTPRYAN